MQKLIKIHLILCQFIFICNLFMFSHSKPLVGQDVRIALDGDFPYIVSIGYLVNGTQYSHFCTGALISNRDVLTAEHCLDNRNVDSLRVSIGSLDLRGGRKFQVSWWMSYDDWAENDDNRVSIYPHNDIAIVRLALTLSNRIVPVPLSDKTHRRLVGAIASLGGWGKLDNDIVPSVMHVGDVTVLDTSECEGRVSQLSRESIHFDSNVFCTNANPSVLIHKGDSGGPLIHHNKVIGVNLGSSPFPNIYEHPEKVNIHIGIYYYRFYIYDIIQNHI